MAGILHKLENNEAILLMYVAGELPPEDRVEVDQLLATDAGMRAELERVAAGYRWSIGLIEAADAGRPLSGGDEATARRVMREIKRRDVELAARAKAPGEAPPQRAIPTWLYPVMTAAAALFVYLGLWVFNVIEPQVKMVAGPTTTPTSAPGGEESGTSETDIAGELARSLGMDDLDEGEDEILDVMVEPVADERVAHWML